MTCRRRAKVGRKQNPNALDGKQAASTDQLDQKIVLERPADLVIANLISGHNIFSFFVGASPSRAVAASLLISPVGVLQPIVYGCAL
jgi:hypothetical protein